VTRKSWSVGLLGTAFALIIVLPQIARDSWDPAVRLAVGSQSGVRDVIEEKLGEVPLTATRGHDGQIFFLMAHDPFLANPESIALILDRPTYRYQRIALPLLAWPAAAVSERAIVWALVLIGVVAVFVGTSSLSDYAERCGMTPLAGLAFVLNPGVVSALLITGSGVLAWAFGAAAMSAVVRRRRLTAIGLFTAAVLTRESMLLVAAGASLWMWRTERARALGYAFVPFLGAILWGLYVRWRLPGEQATDFLELGFPMRGIVSAVSDWISQGLTLDTVMGLAMVGVAVLLVVQFVKSPSLLAFGAVGFSGLAVFLTENVWISWFDSSRALIPATSAVIVGIIGSRVREFPDESVAGPSPS